MLCLKVDAGLLFPLRRMTTFSYFSRYFKTKMSEKESKISNAEKALFLYKADYYSERVNN